MKTIRNKHEKMKQNTATPGVAGRPRRAQHRPFPQIPQSALYEVVMLVDSLAASSLYHRSSGFHRLSVSPGPEDDCFLVRATISSPSQLLQLATWAASMEPNVTVRSPSFLRKFVRFMAFESADITN